MTPRTLHLCGSRSMNLKPNYYWVIDSVLHAVCVLLEVEAKTLETMAALSIRDSSGREINQRLICLAFFDRLQYNLLL